MTDTPSGIRVIPASGLPRRRSASLSASSMVAAGIMCSALTISSGADDTKMILARFSTLAKICDAIGPELCRPPVWPESAPSDGPRPVHPGRSSRMPVPVAVLRLATMIMTPPSRTVPPRPSMPFTAGKCSDPVDNPRLWISRSLRVRRMCGTNRSESARPFCVLHRSPRPPHR